MYTKGRKAWLTLSSGQLIGLKEGTHVEIIHAVWNYVKLQNLIDKTDRRRIILDAPLKQMLFAFIGTSPDAILFSALPEIVGRAIGRADPIKLQYTLDPTVPPADKPQAWDVQLKVEDQALKAKMAGVTVNASPQTTAELSKLDDEVRITERRRDNRTHVYIDCDTGAKHACFSAQTRLPVCLC